MVDVTRNGSDHSLFCHLDLDSLEWNGRNYFYILYFLLFRLYILLCLRPNGSIHLSIISEEFTQSGRSIIKMINSTGLRTDP